eukprot:698545_1
MYIIYDKSGFDSTTLAIIIACKYLIKVSINCSLFFQCVLNDILDALCGSQFQYSPSVSGNRVSALSENAWYIAINRALIEVDVLLKVHVYHIVWDRLFP